MSRFTLSTILTIVLSGFVMINFEANAVDACAALNVPKENTSKMSDAARANLEKACEWAAHKEIFSDCNKAQEEYQKVTAELDTNCAEARAFFDQLIAKTRSSDEAAANPRQACTNNIVRCRSCGPGADYAIPSTNEVKCFESPSSSEDDDDSDSKSKSSPVAGLAGAMMGSPLNSGKQVDKKAIEEELINCLPQNADEIKGLKESTTTLRSDIRKSQKDIAAASTELSEINTDSAESVNSNRDKAEAIQNKAQDEVEKIASELEEGNAQALNQIQNDTMAIDAKIRELSYKKNDANQAYNNALLNMDQGCHANALARTEAARKEVADKIKQGIYSGGNFTSLMTGIGESSRQMFRKMARNFYLDCRNDDSYKMAKKAADASKANAETSIAQEINSLENQKTILRARLTQLQSTASKKAIAAMQRVQKNMELQLTRLEREGQNNARKAQAKLMQKGMEINRLNAELSSDQSDYDQENTKYRLLKKYKGLGRGGGKDGAIDKASAAYDRMSIAASAIVSACCFSADTQAVGGSPIAKSAERACTEICGKGGSEKLNCPTKSAAASPEVVKPAKAAK